MHSTLLRRKNLGLIIANGDQNSDLPTMLGILPHRRRKLEEAVNLEVVLSPNPTNLTIMAGIQQIADNANELSYCMYYFGTKHFKRGIVETTLGDD